MKKKEYKDLNMETIIFNSEDVIVTSYRLANQDEALGENEQKNKGDVMY